MIPTRSVILAAFLVLISNMALSQRGKEGDFTVTGANTIVNTYTNLTANATAGGTSITVANNAMTGGAFGGALQAGDLLLIIQMQGATLDINTVPVVFWGGNYTVPDDYITGTFGANPHFWGRVTGYGNSGRFEKVEVLSTGGGGVINLNCALQNNYTSSGHVQVVRIARYNDLTVNAGASIVPTLWNGASGGIVAVEVSGNLTINATGEISASEAGFRGGALDPIPSFTGNTTVPTPRRLGTSDSQEGSEKGEGIGGFYAELDPLSSRYGIGAPANGGGGGGYQNTGGGGGSNVVLGAYTGNGTPQGFAAVWNLEAAGFGGSASGGGGRGGYSYSNVDANELVDGPNNAAWGGDARKTSGGFGGHPLPFNTSLIFAGGGGGAGDQDSGEGGAGGRGGGLVFLTCYGTIAGTGSISASGEDGQSTNPTLATASAGNPFIGNDGAGGGGAGGSVHIESAGALPGGMLVDVHGGDGGNQNISIYQPGAPFPPNPIEAGGPGGSGSGGLVVFSTGAPSRNLAAGTPGASTSPAVTNFTPNGATAGSNGISLPATVNYFDLDSNGATICSGQTANVSVTVLGTQPGGTTINWYTSMVGGTSINTGTTFTTPALTTTTTYWVGICPGTFRVPVIVTVAPPDDASFNYGAATYCISDADPTPTVTGLAGGTFSGTAGLVINGTTGEIDLSASTAGAHTITYTTNGPCPNSSNVNITITALDDASFNYASTTFCSSDTDPTPTVTGETGGTFSGTAGLVIDGTTGVIDLSASTTGAHTVTYTTSAPCANSSNVNITINALDDASFSYAAATFCATDTDPTPTITGEAGGSFSGTAGLVIDGTTGVIDLSASTTGTHTITYTTTAPCANTSNVNITINPQDDASFNYGAATYCTTDADPTPTITGLAGGTFSGSAGLVINTTTGEIDLDASTTGAHTITYTTLGPCPNNSNVNVTITPAEDASFSYATGTYCVSGTDPTPTVTGTTGGTFSGSAGLVINTTTGVIDLDASGNGTYTVTYTTPGTTCGASQNFGITITTAPSADITYTTPVCEGGATISPTLGAGASIGTFSFAVVSGGPTLSLNTTNGDIDLSTSNAGTYDVTNSIPAAGGCAAASSTFQIVVTPLDDASFNYGAATYCSSDTDPTPTVTGLAGGTFSGSAGLVINGGTGEIDLSASTTGAHTITYTTNGTCPNSSNVNITINALDDASFSYGAATYCISDTDPTPTITGEAGGTFSGTAGLVINGTTGEIDLSASTTGAHTVTYTTTAPCANTSNVNITITALDDASFSYAAASYCLSDTDPIPTITGEAGGAFSGTAGLVINATTGVIDVSASTVGAHTVTYTTLAPCTNASNVNITITNLDDASFSYASTSFCSSDTDPTATITGETGGAFTGTAGLVINGTTGEIDLSASTAGAHTVTYTTAAPCTNTSNVNITITALDDASFSYAVATFCPTDTDPTPTVTGEAGGTFSGTAGLVINTTTGEIDLSASTTGAHTITYTTTAPCVNSSNVNITINGLDAAAFGYAAATYCTSDTDPTPTVTGLAGGTFSSPFLGASLNTTTGVIDLSLSTPGPYTITYTTNGACPNTSNVNVTINALDDASFSYGAATYCTNDTDPSPTVTGLAGGTFSGTAGLVINATTGDIDVSASTLGAHTITYTTNGACPNTSNVNVTINALDDASYSYSAASYCLSAADQTPTITGLTGGAFTSTPAGLSINGTTGVINVAGSTPGVYTVTYTTAGACPNTQDVSVTINALDDATFALTATCDGGTASVTGLAGGTFSFNTAPGDAAAIDASTGTISGGTSGATYDVLYTTNGPCPNTSTQTVTALTSDDATFSLTPACNGATATVTGTTGGTFSFVTAPTDGATIDPATGAITGGSSGGNYTVQYTTTGVCPATSTQNVTALPSPTIDPIADQTACDQFTLPAITGTNLSGNEAFYDNSQAMGGTQIAGPITTSQTVYVYDSNMGCTDEISFVVTINATDNPNFTTDAFCEGDVNTINMIGTPGGTFSLTPAPTDGASIDATTGVISNGVGGTTYTIQYVTNGVCPSSSTYDVLVRALPSAPTVTGDGTYCVAQDLPDMTASSTNGGTFTWYDDSGLSSSIGTGGSQAPYAATSTGTTDYYVTETVAGCEGPSSMVTIVIEDCDITVPTAITPNGDNANDDWELMNIDNRYPNNVVKVYNRWGNLIFESPTGDYDNNRWNGTYRGNLLPVGSYYYIIEFNDGSTDSKTGTVSIILD